MPYPHVTQFETLARGRRIVGAAEMPSRAAAHPARPRRGLPRPGRLRRTPRCSSVAT
jgi:hypothetical protein